MAARLQVLLRERQRLARRDADLPRDEVDAGDHLGDRVLDLQARVHLEEVEVRRPGPRGTRPCRRRRSRPPRPAAHRGLAHARAHLRRRRPATALSSMQLLVAALDRALALAEVHAVAVRVGQDLDLDVARRVEVASRGRGVRRRRRDRASAARAAKAPRARLGLAHDAHALAAAAGRGLEQHRVADLARRASRAARRRRPGRVARAPPARRPSPSCGARATLSPIAAIASRRRADEDEPGVVDTRSAKAAFSDRKP